MIILVGCEESQSVANALRELGHEAYSCDLKPCSGGHPEYHLQMDIFQALTLKPWDMFIFFPDCTFITLTGNKWFKDQPPRESGALVGAERRRAREAALDFICRLWNIAKASGIKKIVIENPVGVIGTRIMKDSRGYLMIKPDSATGGGYLFKPSQIIQPFQFGHPEPKKTCLWIEGLPLLVPTKIVEPEYHVTKTGKRLPKWYAYADKSKGQKHRAEIRSKTFSGISSAMALQWAGKIN